ncbi:hypothetical protein JK361_07590 [Streptomyces sp. 5-8]|uniref:2'-5' RNA ligase n=2 Tax=Streptomyces TaxID=1883 RepID=A0ABS1NWG2_9ACTN|nr:hypothetical protein [Streptomyces musisoli]MBL1104462.1 hypothetical protein [Streptomyces musisoli]
MQNGEQVRLGVEHTGELREMQTDITQRLGITEDGYWPHVTLGLARAGFPRSDAEAMRLPTLDAPAPTLDMQQEMTATDFRILVKRPLT